MSALDVRTPSALPWVGIGQQLRAPLDNDESRSGLTTAPRDDGGGRVQFRTLRQLASSGLVGPPRWLWKGYIAIGAVTLLAGRPKCGKSTLIFALLRALEENGTFLGLDVSPTSVLYLSEEDVTTLREKAARFGCAETGVRFLTRRDAFPRESFRTWMQSAMTAARRTGSRLVVIDTLAFWGGLGPDAEKDAGAVQALLDPLHELASAGLAVLLIHHTRKSGGGDTSAIRGSTALAAGVDIVAELEREGGAGHEARRILTAYSRYKDTPERLLLELGSEGYRGLGAPGALVRTYTETVKAALPTRSPGCTQAEIAAATGISQQRVAEVLGEPCDAIVRGGTGKRGDPFRYHRRPHAT